MVVYSFSQINLYQQCPKKYQYRYLDGLEKEFETTPDLLLWTCVHAALEWLYQQVSIFKNPQKSDLIAQFYSLREQSLLNTQGKLIYKGDQNESDYLRRGEHYLAQYFDQHAPFDEGKLIATEMRINFDLSEQGESWSQSPKFRWVIDRLDKQWDTFIINDYKTNKNLPPEDKDEYREQLTLYAQGIQQKYGKYLKKIKARLHYLHFDLTDQREITEEVLLPIVEKYRKIIAEIENARFEHNIGVEEAFPTKSNPYCKYCEYQNICPLWSHLNYAGDLVDGGGLGESTIKAMVDHYTQLANALALQNKEKDQLKEILISYAEKWGFQQLFGDHATLKLSKSQTYAAKDKLQLQKLLDELGILDEAIDIPHYKIAALVKNKKLTPQQVQSYLESKPSWRVTVSKNTE